MATTSTRTRIPREGTVTATATTTPRWPASISASAGSACIRSSARSWWAWSTAGSAAVALLVLASIREALPAFGYLVVFGLGTIVGMMLITIAIAVPFACTARRFIFLHRSLAFTAGVLSVGFGLFLVYHIGFIGGLFTGQYRWTPQ
jgi:hypothetical protein